MKLSHVLVLPTYREGLPNVLLQAGALGIPVIATEIVGCTDIVENKLNGLLVKPKSVEEIYDAMLELYNNRELYNYLKENSRQYILKKYDQESVWKEILKEYNSLLRISNNLDSTYSRPTTIKNRHNTTTTF